MSTIPELTPIPGYEKYFASRDGRIWSTWHTKGVPLREMKQTKSSRGYKDICLINRKGKKDKHFVHRLILTTFVGECPKNMQCRHLDGSRDNNNIENLRWGTAAQDAADKIRHGTMASGELNGRSKLTEQEVVEIRESYANGETQTSVAVRFGVSQPSVSRIVLKRGWQHV